MKKYLVGGAVRDGLLGREPAERDWVVVGATPDELEQSGFRQVGRDFPVFLHPENGEQYALARTERRTGPGHADFVCRADPDVTLEEDLMRRDLTINAIALDGADYIDPAGGRRDLDARLLRHVSPAFREDPLRVFRVARFAATLPGFQVCDETAALMADMTGELAALSGERVWQEFRKAMAAERPHRFYEVLLALDGADWFRTVDLAAAAKLYESRRLQGDVGLIALGWLASAETTRELYARLRAPRIYVRGAPLLARHGRVLADQGATADALVDAFAGIGAFRPGAVADLVVAAATQCAGVPAEPLARLLAELRAIRVEAPPGPAHGKALREKRLRHIRRRQAAAAMP